MQTIIKAIIAFILFLTIKTSGQNTYDFSEKLTNYLSIQNKRLNFNGVVLVANQDSILYQKAMGMSSHELKVPLSVNFKFKVASISKSFTGVLAAIAEKEGKLKLNDKIAPYFSDYKLKEGWKHITIQHLISHTSGIPHWNGYKDYWAIKSKLSLTNKQILEDVFKMDLLFLSGDAVNYSSPAYFILANILEKIYKTNYTNILNRKIIKPLKLNSTGVFNERTIIPNKASGYHVLHNDSLIPAPYRSISTLKGAGNIYSNTKDMLKWNRSMLDTSFWGKDLLQTIFTKTTNKKMPHNNNAFYGMGWYIHENVLDRPKSYQVAGGMFGFSSISIIYPDKGLHVILLSNVSFLPVNEIWNDIEKIIFNKPFKLPELIKSKVISKEWLEKLTGAYVANNGMKLNVFIYQSKLFVKLGENPPLEIVSDQELIFNAKKINIRFMFKKGMTNKIEGLITEGRGEVHEFKRI